MPLSNKQQAFVQEYCTNGFNGTQAYIKAGYSKTGARFNASRLITKDNVKTEIDRLKTERQAKIEYNYEKAAQKLFDRLGYIQKAASGGNIQAVQVQLAILREANDISGLHKQIIVDETQVKELTEAEQLEARRLASLRLRKGWQAVDFKPKDTA